MKKKVLALAAACAAFVGVQSASAHLDWDGFYVGASGSVDWIRDTKFVQPSPGGFAFDLDHKTGGNAALSVGYQWCEWRAELEGGFRHNSIDVSHSSATGFPDETHSIGKHTRIWSIMANGYYDIPFENCFSMYVGLGVGVGFHQLKVDQHSNAISGPAPFFQAAIDRTSTLFAWQVMSGLNYEVNDMWTVFLGYKFFATMKPKSFTVTNTGLAPSTQQTTTYKDFPYAHGIEAGVRFRM